MEAFQVYHQHNQRPKEFLFFCCSVNDASVFAGLINPGMIGAMMHKFKYGFNDETLCRNDMCSLLFPIHFRSNYHTAGTWRSIGALVVARRLQGGRAFAYPMEPCMRFGDSQHWPGLGRWYDKQHGLGRCVLCPAKRKHGRACIWVYAGWARFRWFVSVCMCHSPGNPACSLRWVSIANFSLVSL